MLATLGGLDALVFTGGVGENVAEIRARACEAFAFLGVKVDNERNKRLRYAPVSGTPANEDIADSDSAVRVLVVHSEEDWAIATECWKLADSGVALSPELPL